MAIRSNVLRAGQEKLLKRVGAGNEGRNRNMSGY